MGAVSRTIQVGPKCHHKCDLTHTGRPCDCRGRVWRDIAVTQGRSQPLKLEEVGTDSSQSLQQECGSAGTFIPAQ